MDDGIPVDLSGLYGFLNKAHNIKPRSIIENPIPCLSQILNRPSCHSLYKPVLTDECIKTVIRIKLVHFK